MKSRILPSILILLSMISALAIAEVLRPTKRLSEQGAAINLEVMIPISFGEWKEDKSAATVVVNPQTEAFVHRVYSQTLARTYVSEKGARIMLSLAYGTDQRDEAQLHYPETCYPAQGFLVRSTEKGSLSTAHGSIPIKRLKTELGKQRFEPVTYWTTVGDIAITGGINKKIAEMRYGFRGVIPDGLLFRISSIDPDAGTAFAVHDAFVRDLIDSLPTASRRRLAGLEN